MFDGPCFHLNFLFGRFEIVNEISDCHPSYVEVTGGVRADFMPSALQVTHVAPSHEFNRWKMQLLLAEGLYFLVIRHPDGL